jgi:hypothetical protein
MDDQSGILIEYLRGLPHAAVVHWASDHVPERLGWTTKWIDVRITDPGSPPFNWAWTIIGHDDPDGTGPEQLWQFVWPYDLDVHLVQDPVDWEVNVWPAARGEPPPRCIAAAYRTLPQRVGGRYVVHGGWTAGAVDDALTHWAGTHAGRPDLTATWARTAGPSAILSAVAERARDAGPMWDLGEGLEVADGALDDLLALDPEEAAEITIRLRRARERFLRLRGGDPGS